MSTLIYSYNDYIRSIDGIEFNILGNNTIKEMSVFGKESVGVEIPDLYDNMQPRSNGLLDGKFGPPNISANCSTCGLGLGNNGCPGHFGHIDFVDPVFHIGYLPFVRKILGCVCISCSKLLVHKNEHEIQEMLKHKSKKARLAEIKNLVKGVTSCGKQGYGCGAPVFKIKVETKKSTGEIVIIAETDAGKNTDNEDVFVTESGKKKMREILTPERCYQILKNISPIDCMIMGLDPEKSRPEDMIHKSFPVPPIQVRPSVRADFLASATMEDDLTHKLTYIVKANTRIRKQKEKDNTNANFASTHAILLQTHVSSYFDNEQVALAQTQQRGANMKSLSSRLKSKGGRVRGNLMGKRVDFSARTVITPDPSLDINQLGVPVKIAMTLTVPEIVTENNIAKLTKLVRNGRSRYPGANYVFQKNFGRLKDLHIVNETIELRYGDVVERHLQNDDMVLLNRQPTLHKLSMMGHRVKVVDNDDYQTFRLNVAVTTPYNADRSLSAKAYN